MDINSWFSNIFWGAMLVGFVLHIKNKNYTKEDYKKGLKILGFVGVIVGLICLFGDTNQNPNSVWDRVFRPLSGGNWTISYGGIIPYIIIYWSLGKIYELSEFSWIDEWWKKVIAISLILNFLNPIQEEVIKIYRSFQTGVDAIYLYRDNTSLKVTGTERDGIYCLEISGEMRLENVSNKPVRFDVWINVPPEYQELIGEEWIQVYPEKLGEYTIGPKSVDWIGCNYKMEISDALVNKQKRSSNHVIFEVVLKDEQELAYFEGAPWYKNMYEKEMQEIQ